MCGIGGVHYRASSSIDVSILESMAKSLAHRGPDDEGIEIYDKTAFVHRRLSIIDLESGHQPLKSPMGLRLVVNGEIYNYIELKSEYSAYQYKTSSDCEVLLALYEKIGMDFLSDIRGMYALALYDESSDRLILARDPFGIKQLYYAFCDDGVVFASEPGAIAKSLPAYEAYVDPNVQSQLLQSRYSYGSNTIFSGIKKLLPGEVIVFKGGELEKSFVIEPIKQISHSGSLPKLNSIDFKFAQDKFEDLMIESVGLHLRSHVPYGLFLSGGLDSGSILHFMHKVSDSKGPIRTFTMGFDHGSVHDERKQAMLWAKHYGCEHTELVCSKNDFWSVLPFVAQAVDDPVFDQSLVPTYLLAREAAKSVKVVLCGEGGDELLAGYRRYQKANLYGFFGVKPYREKGVIDKAGLQSIHLSSWQQGMRDLSERSKDMFDSFVSRRQWLDLKGWLAESLLIKLDRCLMAHGLEGRTPFLEPHLGNFCFHLPDKLKVNWRFGKLLLRNYLHEHAPHLMPFQKKKGFRVPVGAWYKEKAKRLAPLIAKQAGIADIFDYYEVRDFLSHPSSSAHEEAAWMLLFYALWHQIHIMKKTVVPDTASMLLQ
jgi:asparagine synthase (glutamine-hydrolysing)